MEAEVGAELGGGHPGTAEPQFSACLLRLLAALALGLAIGALAPAPGIPLRAADSAPTPQLYLPLMATASAPCPTTSDRQYRYARILGKPTDRPAAVNPDLNLAVRGYLPTGGSLSLLDLDGPTDSDPPQLPALFSPARLPALRSVHQVYDWDWGCGQDGCRGQPIAWPPVTLLAVAANPGETLYPPARRAAIHEDGYVALVLYAEERRLTLKYTLEDSPAVGYMVHLEEVCVDANLLALYRRLDEEGRRVLPALRNGDPLGSAGGDALRVAVRDTGSFMEPRSRKDWWQGY